MISTMISYVNSFTGIQPWFHNIFHSTEFIDEFTIWIHIWFHKYEFNGLNSWIDSYIYEFWCMISQYFSWPWIHICIHFMNSYMISWLTIHILYFMTYEFRHEFMYMKKNREIMYQIMGTKVPDGGVSRMRECQGHVSVRGSPQALYDCQAMSLYIITHCWKMLSQFRTILINSVQYCLLWQLWFIFQLGSAWDSDHRLSRNCAHSYFGNVCCLLLLQ